MAENPKPHPGFKKGVSGNPKGRPRVFGENSGVEKLSNDTLGRIISRYFSMSMGEIYTRLEDHRTPSLEAAIAASIKTAVTKGRMQNITSLLDRVVGKPKEQMSIDIKAETKQALAQIPTEDLVSFLREKRSIAPAQAGEE